MKKQHIGVFALILGIALAFGTTTSKSNELYSVYARLENNTWILVTEQTDEDYECVPDEEICKAEFSSDPDDGPATQGDIIEDDGVYVLR